MSEKRKRSANRWWFGDWIKILESYGWTAELARGRIHARAGNIHGFRVAAGRIQANVQDREQNSCHVLIKADVIPISQWEKILDLLADKAIFMAKLMTGEMPNNLHEIFEQAGSSLFPQYTQNLHISCSCKDENSFCRHAAAVLYAFMMKLDEDPLLLFRFRGIDRKTLFEALKQRRSIGTEAFHNKAEEDYDELQWENQSDRYAAENYWVGEMDKADINIRISSPSTEEYVFSKLGEPSFFGGKRDMVRQLKRDYQRILSKALTAGYSQEEE